MSNHKYYFLFLCLCIVCTFIALGTVSDSQNLSVSDNVTLVNGSGMLQGIEYPVTGNESPDTVSSSLDFSGNYANAGQLSTEFSGASTEATGNSQIPAAEISFSDKSSVSGFIKQFVKSFRYESGIDL